MSAPAYPRIPHLVPGRGTADDRVLAPSEVASLLARPVVVEEKLDGANVSVWMEGGSVQVALRSGPGSMDRAGQLGPLRAWVARHHDALASLLGPGGLVMYGEWLFVTHTVAYDRLESLLVCLDLRRTDGTFLVVDERNAAGTAAGLSVPPELWRGIPAKPEVVEALLGRSRYGPAPAEGVVVRSADGSEPRVAKLVPAGFSRLGEDDWARGRPRNRLAQEASWR